ncbi:C-X-C chemokine receptor type 3-like [Pseudophryne corroboree]|uniref:C-X-C chemokine receptor type 3-like n=1 Tax=Pseudophryne corroboree TaxID=495146 RepID=UPI00308150E6
MYDSYKSFTLNSADFDNSTFAYSAYSDSEDVTPCSQEENKIFDQSFVPAFYSLLFLAGILGNGLVMTVLLPNRQKMQSTDIFILHLALADLLLVATLPFWAVQTTLGWVFGQVLCKIVASIFKINFYAGTFLLTCISFDRYLSIVYAVQVYKRHRMDLVHWSCFIVWCLCFILSIPDAMYYSVSLESRINMTVCEPFFPISTSRHWKVALTFLFHIMGFLLPLVGMLYCYSHIILTLLNSQGFKKQKALRLIIAVVVAFFLCWSPYNIAAFIDTVKMLQLNSSCDFETKIDIALSVTSGLCYFHSCLNPVLYAFIGTKFKSNLAEMFSNTRLCPQFVAQYVKRRQPSTRSSTRSDSGDTSLSGVY